MWDGEAFGAEIVSAVKQAIERATAPLIARIQELETIALGITPREEIERLAKAAVDAQPGPALIATPYQLSAEDKAEIQRLVTEAVEALPKPKDGRDGVDGKDGRDGINGKDGTAGEKGEAGEPGRDGRDGTPAPVVAGAIKDHTGELVLTLTDGTILRTGIYDGEKGADGKDGRDGFGLEDFSAELKDGRTLALTFARGDLVKSYEFALPIVLDRGVFKAGETYAEGDGVTWGGSFWIAQEATSEKPDTGKGWRLAVKKGRDGKDGVRGEPGPKGDKGDPGVDRRA